jgi:hypothetical protein
MVNIMDPRIGLLRHSCIAVFIEVGLRFMCEVGFSQMTKTGCALVVTGKLLAKRGYSRRMKLDTRICSIVPLGKLRLRHQNSSTRL